MPSKSNKPQPLQSVSIPTMDAPPQSLSAHRQQLTPAGQQSQQLAPSAENTVTYTPHILKPLTPISAANRNDQQLLADILKPTAEMLRDLGLLTWGRTQGGKLFILLSDTFNDDLTLRGQLK